MLNTHTLNTQALNARRAAAVDLSRLHGVMRMSGALWPTVWGALSGEMAMHGGRLLQPVIQPALLGGMAIGGTLAAFHATYVQMPPQTVELVMDGALHPTFYGTLSGAMSLDGAQRFLTYLNIPPTAVAYVLAVDALAMPIGHERIAYVMEEE